MSLFAFLLLSAPILTMHMFIDEYVLKNTHFNMPQSVLNSGVGGGTWLGCVKQL